MKKDVMLKMKKIKENKIPEPEYKLKICECCKNVFKYYIDRQKLCNRCTVYHKDLRAKINYYRKEVKRLKLLIYGTKQGSERIRWNNKKNKES